MESLHSIPSAAKPANWEKAGVAPSQSMRPKQAAALLGIGAATLWRWVKERPDFPRPIRLSARCTVFDCTQLMTWRDAQRTAALQAGSR